MKYIVDCQIKCINDLDDKGRLLLNPIVHTESYSKIFDTKEEVMTFLDREMPVVRIG